MNSSLLIEQIKRLLDTDGSCGDGSSVATAYVNAVNQANRRLNTCMSYLAEGQHSEAIRISEENPELLDECAKLSFVQYPQWQTLCMENGWAVAETINEYSTEKLNAIYGSATALEPLLKTYRKAVRSQDQMLAIRCLRRIISMDKGNAAWQQDLATFESRHLQVQKAEFVQAAKMNDKAAMLRIAGEIEAGGWSVPVDSKLLGDIAEMRRSDREASWQLQFAEDMNLLRKAFEDKNFRKTAKYLANVQALESQGFITPVTEKGFLEDVFNCCKEIDEREKREELRNQLLADLHRAIELESEQQIRVLLSSPEFVDCPPDEDIEKRSRLVLQRFEMKRSRKRMQIAAFILVLLVGAGIAGGLKYKQVRYDTMKVALTQRLKLAYDNKDEGTLKTILQETKTNNPEFYEDGEIKIWEQKQSEVAKQNTMRREAFDSLVQEIQKRADAKFKDHTQQDTQSKLDDAKAKLLPNDIERNTRLAKLLAAFNNHCLETANATAKKAADQLDTLVQGTTKLVEVLKSSPYTKTLETQVEASKSAFGTWQQAYSSSFPSLDVKCREVLASLIKHQQEAKGVSEQVERIKTAKNIDEWIACRDVLVKYCSTYPEVKPLLSLMSTPYKDAVDGSLSVFRQNAVETKKFDLKAATEKLEKIRADILEYKAIKAQTAMYAVYPQGTAVKQANAILYSLKPPVRSPSPKGVGERISGIFWIPKKSTEGFSDSTMDTLSTLTFSLMPHCKYINDLIAKAEDQGLDVQGMTKFLFDELQSVLKNTDLTNYKRIQLVKVYFDYIDMLTLISSDNTDVKALFSSINRLAQQLPIGNDPTVSWLLIDFKDVQDRENECVTFLAQNKNLLAKLREPMFLQELSALIARQKIVFIGTVNMSLNSQIKTMNFVNPKESLGSIFALRMEGDTYKLRYVLEHTGDRYFLAAKDIILLSGEPLFVFKGAGMITSLKQEAKQLQKIYQVKDASSSVQRIAAWPVGLEVQ